MFLFKKKGKKAENDKPKKPKARQEGEYLDVDDLDDPRFRRSSSLTGKTSLRLFTHQLNEGV